MSILEKLKRIRKFSDPRYLANQAMVFSASYLRIITFLVVIGLVGYCIYLWYGTIYRPGWSDFQKQEYIKTKTPETTFNKNGFEYDISAFQLRAEESQKKLENLTDIFRLDQLDKSSQSDSSLPSDSVVPGIKQ